MFLTELLLEYLILRPESVDDLLLLAIQPTGQSHEKELPRLRNVFHNQAKAPPVSRSAGRQHYSRPKIQFEATRKRRSGRVLRASGVS